MAIDRNWLDELAARTSLSGLIGRSVTLRKAGREHKGCCPFHHEKTPSFTVNDDKGFYHCFGCGAHGDAVRWLVEHDGLSWIDAVRQLAEAAGMAVPARTPAAAERAARIDGIRPAIEAAAAFYAHQLDQCGAAREYLNARGFGPEAVARFGLGWAPAASGHVQGIPGMTFEAARDSGLIWVDAETGRDGATFRERVMVPVHDARGRVIGFAGRSLPGGADPKYKNSPASEIFDKGRVLFNLHRAVERLREGRGVLASGLDHLTGLGGAQGRLLVVEGQFDALTLDMAGLAAVAPMGTALTIDQLNAAWRVAAVPVLLFDGDAAGAKAAMRAAVLALPHIVPGQSIDIALMPAGMDPDEAVRAEGPGLISMVVSQARRMWAFLFDAVVGEAGDWRRDPDAVAAVWERLAQLGATIGHDELRAQYLADWRARFDERISLARAEVMRAGRAEVVVSPGSLSRRQADAAVADGGDAVDVDDADRAEAEPAHDGVVSGEERLIDILQTLLRLRAQRADISADIRDRLSVAKALGYSTKALNATLRDMEADPERRIDGEAMHALYRRVAGVRGPIFEDVLPQLTEARVTAAMRVVDKRSAKTMALLDAATPSREPSHG